MHKSTIDALRSTVKPALVGIKPRPVRDEEFEAAAPEDRGKQLPEPAGYRILCAVPAVEDTFDNSTLLRTDKEKDIEHILATVLFVLKLGPDCYKDEKKFPTGPWCKEGDFIVVRPHAGTKLMVQGTELRLLTDDSIEAVVSDPRGVRRGK